MESGKASGRGSADSVSETAAIEVGHASGLSSERDRVCGIYCIVRSSVRCDEIFVFAHILRPRRSMG